MYATDPPRRHGALIAVLLVLALVFTLGAAISIWLDRQALSDRGWSDTSERVLENPQVRTAVGAEIVTQLFERGHVNQRLDSAAGPLSGVAADELHKLATRLAITALGTPQIERAWKIANRRAHRQLVADIEHDRDEDVHLRVTPILNDLLHALRNSRPVTALPGPVRHLFDIRIGGNARIRVLRADQVNQVRVAINTVRNLVLVLSLLAAICLVLTIVVATGRHLRAVAYVGACLALCGGILLGARALIGPALADGLVPAAQPANRAAVRATWSIGTSQLHTTAIIALIVGGILLVGGAIASIIAGRRGPQPDPWGPE